jgi:hypothetical protein
MPVIYVDDQDFILKEACPNDCLPIAKAFFGRWTR